jgi:hypothetical protein
VQAVLSIWTVRRRPREVCQELGIRPAVLAHREKRALAAMLKALELQSSPEPEPALIPKLERLLARQALLQQKGWMAKLHMASSLILVAVVALGALKFGVPGAIGGYLAGAAEYLLRHQARQTCPRATFHERAKQPGRLIAVTTSARCVGFFPALSLCVARLSNQLLRHDTRVARLRSLYYYRTDGHSRCP